MSDLQDDTFLTQPRGGLPPLDMAYWRIDGEPFETFHEFQIYRGFDITVKEYLTAQKFLRELIKKDDFYKGNMFLFQYNTTKEWPIHLTQQKKYSWLTDVKVPGWYAHDKLKA